MITAGTMLNASTMPPIAESGEFYPPAPLEVQVGGATVFVLKAETARL